MLFQVKYFAKFMLGIPVEAETYEQAIVLAKNIIDKGLSIDLMHETKIERIDEKIEFSGVDNLDHWEF